MTRGRRGDGFCRQRTHLKAAGQGAYVGTGNTPGGNDVRRMPCQRAPSRRVRGRNFPRGCSPQGFRVSRAAWTRSRWRGGSTVLLFDQMGDPNKWKRVRTKSNGCRSHIVFTLKVHYLITKILTFLFLLDGGSTINTNNWRYAMTRKYEALCNNE